jgi:uncharacterized protein YkwD
MRPAALFLAAPLLLAQGLPSPPASQPGKATAFERAVVAEMSDIRVRPRAWARILKELRPYFEGTLWKRPGRTPLRTEEGLVAYDEAIAYLEAARPLGPLRFNEGLARAARLHAQDIGPRGLLDHVGADGSSLAERLNRLGTWHSAVGENIGTLEEDPRQVVIQLLVDDGVPGRGHRHNLFNPGFHQAGAGVAPHRDYRTVIVIDYADGFVEGRPSP